MENIIINNDFNERKFLLNTINLYEQNMNKLYQKKFLDQLEIISKFYDFIKTNPNCFLRENLHGHITGSAFVVNQYFTKVLFTYHAKLHRWLQLGGHADGQFMIQDVALKEAQEESGMENFQFIDILKFPSLLLSNDYNKMIPFDLDIHFIPERPSEPAHYHYDVRFILVAQHENFKISAESLDLKWIKIDEVPSYTSEKSTLRQVHKLKYLLGRAVETSNYF